MALKTDALKKYLKGLHWTDEAIAKYIDSAQEMDLGEDLPKIHVYDEAGFNELTVNTRTKAEREALEIHLRKLNKDNELGLSAADAKDAEKVYAAMRAKAATEATKTPPEWDTKFKTLQDSLTAKDTEVLTAKQELELLRSEKKYSKMFWPEMDDALDNEEWVARLQKNFDIKKDGEIEGLWDKTTGAFVVDDKANTIPYLAAWAKIRTSDRFKKWNKAVVVADPANPDPKKTHAPAPRNPANPAPKKYTNFDDIIKEVDKKYPPGSKIPQLSRLRREYTEQLRYQLA